MSEIKTSGSNIYIDTWTTGEPTGERIIYRPVRYDTRGLPIFYDLFIYSWLLDNGARYYQPLVITCRGRREYRRLLPYARRLYQHVKRAGLHPTQFRHL